MKKMRFSSDKVKDSMSHSRWEAVADLGGRVLRISEQLEYAASIPIDKKKKESPDGWLTLLSGS